MKIKAGLSAALGIAFGLGAYFILEFLAIDNALAFSIMSGLLFYLLIFCYLVVHGKVMDKKYNKFEKEITSPIFYKANGNFNLGNGKVKNGNIYFCDEGIVCVCLDEKPYALDEVLKTDIKELYFDNIRLVIETKDDRAFYITTSDVNGVLKALEEKGWIDI